MKVAVFEHLPAGGAKRAARELIRHNQAGHRFELYRMVLPGDPPADDDVGGVCDDVHVHRARSVPLVGHIDQADVRRVRQLVEAAAAERAIAEEIDGAGHDLVVVHSSWLHHGPPLLQRLKTPSLYFVQEPRRQSFEYDVMLRHRPVESALGRARRVLATGVDGWVRRNDIRSTRAATALAANSSYSRELIYRSYGRYADVCYLGVDPVVFAIGAAAQTRDGVLSVGAVDETKDHGLTVDAMALLPPELRQPVTVVAERVQPASLDRLTERAEGQEVELRFVHSVTDERLAELYRSSVATMLTARLEPFGLTALESLACGTPVVAVREGGYRETVVDGTNGHLVDRSPAAVAEALRALLEGRSSFDPEALRSTVMPFFTWEEAARRFDGLMEAAAAVGAGRD